MIGENSSDFLNFVREMRGFGEFEGVLLWRNNRVLAAKKSPKIKSVSEDLSATEMVVSILERTTQTVTICHAFELLRKARQLVTDCHRFKVGDKLSPPLQKKRSLKRLGGRVGFGDLPYYD